MGNKNQKPLSVDLCLFTLRKPQRVDGRAEDMAQLIESLTSMREATSNPQCCVKLRVVLHAYHPNHLEVGAGGWGVQGHTKLYTELEHSL